MAVGANEIVSVWFRSPAFQFIRFNSEIKSDIGVLLKLYFTESENLNLTNLSNFLFLMIQLKQ